MWREATSALLSRIDPSTLCDRSTPSSPMTSYCIPMVESTVLSSFKDSRLFELTLLRPIATNPLPWSSGKNREKLPSYST